MIVGSLKKSVPRMRTVKSKKIKVTTSNSKCLTTTCETSGNIMRLCVNLMPVLAAAKEPVEEEEGEEEDNSCTSKKKPETSSENDPSVTKSVEQIIDPSDSTTGLNVNVDTNQQLDPQFVLPLISQPKAAPGSCDHQKTKRCPLPPISVSEQNGAVLSNFTLKDRGDDVLGRGPGSDSRPWIDNPLLSKSRSPEFRLPDISLSTLDDLLQTVTQKLRRKSRGGDGGPWRRVQADHVLVAVSDQRLREKRVEWQKRRDDRNLANIEAASETSLSGRSASRPRSLPPLFSASKPTLILAMTKKNLLTPDALQ